MFEIGQIGQQPIYSAMSPADAEDDCISRLALLVRELEGSDEVCFLYRPVDVRIVGLEPLFKRMPDILLTADAEVDGLAVEFIETGGEGEEVHRRLVSDRVKTLVNPVLC